MEYWKNGRPWKTKRKKPKGIMEGWNDGIEGDALGMGQLPFFQIFYHSFQFSSINNDAITFRGIYLNA
jgi:hypothetical protein